MKKYSSPQTRLASQLVPIVCGGPFACFSFCYLYFYQSGYLAQLQYHYSHGETTYQPLVGAVLITLPLLLLGAFCHKVVRWPLRFCAVAWFPPAFLLAAVTSLRFAELPGYDAGTPVAALLLSLAAFLAVTCLCLMHPDASGERGTLCGYLSSNTFILSLLFMMTGSIGYSSVPGHHELRMGRLLQEGQYDQAVRCCADTAGVTPRLFALRAAALAQMGELGNSLFEYPVPQGVRTLMPAQSDSQFVYDALPMLYRRMRAVPRSGTAFREQVFLANVLEADSLPRPLALDYLLCSHLLRGELRDFRHQLVRHADSLSTSLPRHYREALVLVRHTFMVHLVSTADGVLSPIHPSRESREVMAALLYEDEEMEASYRRYERLREAAHSGSAEVIDSLAAYQDTYWAYYSSRFLGHK